MARRVVITAESAITPIGDTEERIVESLVKGLSGVRPLRKDDLLSDFIRSKVFGTIDYPIDYHFERQFSKTMGPVAFYACEAARRVLEKAGLPKEFLSSGRMGVAFGSTHGSPTVQRGIYQIFFGERPIKLSSLSAATYLKSMVHTTAANITKMFGITGRVISSCTACTTSSQSLGYGYEAVKFGMQDAMLCGGADEYDTSAVAVFDNLLACSTGFNETPSQTPRPFDRRRDGLVVGEGAGAVLLEEYEFARRRGANILAEVIGFACTNNGGDLILPSLEGVRPTMTEAVRCAEISPSEVDFISAHATATRMGDIVETQAIHAVFGERPYVTGFKGHVGHTMAACGVIETIFTLYTMKHGVVIPTLNLEEVDERCAMVNHTMKLRESPIRIAAIQNFAFGGVNTCLVIKNL